MNIVLLLYIRFMEQAARQRVPRLARVASPGRLMWAQAWSRRFLPVEQSDLPVIVLAEGQSAGASNSSAADLRTRGSEARPCRTGTRA